MSSCIHQEAGIYINPEGYVQLCGISKEKIVGDVPPHICDIDDLDLFYRSSYYSLQRSKSVEHNPYCIACTRREANGVKSLRKMIAEKYPKFGIVPDGTIQHLDICFSNLCNQQCLMCKSESSSRWLKDDKRLENTEFKRKPIKYRNWTKEKGSLDKILNILPTVKILTIKGGEPIIQYEVQEMLEYLVENDLYPRIEILTNFQEVSPFFMSLLKRSKNLVLRISMDSYGSMYNWTRGGDYNAVMDNIQDYMEGDHNKDLGFTNTLNRWSYHNLPESIFEIQKQMRLMISGERFNYNVQPVIGPRYTSPFADPVEKREEMVARFRKFFAREIYEKTLRVDDTIRFGCLNVNHVSNIFALTTELDDEHNTPDLLEKSDLWEKEINKIRGFETNGNL